VDIVFRTRKLEKIFNSEQQLNKEYGSKCAAKIRIRMMVLSRAQTLADVPTSKPDRCHPLKGGMAGEYAVDLAHPFRLVFWSLVTEPPNEQGISKAAVTAIEVLRVEDYH
jgi:proteic killer suppression protein